MGGRLEARRATVAQADAELSAIGTALEREFPDENRGKGLKAMRSAVIPGHIDVFAGFLGLLMAIVGLVLLIACVNLSGMTLARAAGRRRRDRGAAGARRVARTAGAATADRNGAVVRDRRRPRRAAQRMAARGC